MRFSRRLKLRVSRGAREGQHVADVADARQVHDQPLEAHARIDMAEVRVLQTDPARLMHQRLCGWIDPGKSGRVELDTLCGYVWPDEANAEAMKKRRQTARKALAELAAVGWVVNEYAKGKWEIKRPGPTATAPVYRRNVPLLPS